MTSASLLFTAAIGIAGFGFARAEDVNQATLDALAQRYAFNAIATPNAGCHVTLAASPVRHSSEHAMRPVTFNSACRTFASLRGITHWSPTGGASLALFGGKPLQEIADFSPVQDGTGVYLRGGFAGDARVYELRLRQE